MRYKLKSLDPMGVGKTAGTIYFGLALLFVPVMAIFLMAGSVAGNKPFAGAFGVVFGLVMIVFLPVIYGVMGFVIGALMAVVYNFVSRWMGGIIMELVPADSPSVEPVSNPPYPLVPGGTNV